MRILALFILIGTLACNQESQNEESSSKTVLATVYTKKLYAEDILDMVPTSLSSEDSARFIETITDRWVREQIFLVEAERKFPPDFDLQRMVDDYKSSLVKHHYEQQLLENNLDSTITNEELTDFYDGHKQDYKLNEPIYRVKFVKIPTAAPNKERLAKWLDGSKKKTNAKLASYSSTYAEKYILRENAWYTQDELLRLMEVGPKKVKFKKGNSYDFSDGQFSYYILILEKVEVDQIPPLSFVEEKAKAVIIQQRKLKLIQNKKEEMYENALKNKYIRLYESNS